ALKSGHDVRQIVIIDFVKRREQCFFRLLAPIRWIRDALPLGCGDDFIPAWRLFPLVNLTIQTVRAAVGRATPARKERKCAFGNRTVASLAELIWARRERALLERV
ncbi:MAG: hypothetical protein L0Z50_42295, partial [Verrucomicrobiales bacterium]|nr:hypothetical protein [Verrucomicrobiales bacterium]